jgi:hypothetical protein
MRFLRMALVLVLSLGVGLSGHANVRMMRDSCSMTQQHADAPAPHAHGMHAGHHEHGLGDAGHPGDDTAPAGHLKPCGCVTGCHSANFHTNIGQVLVSPVYLARAAIVAEQAFTSHTAFLHWRPPALI